MVWSSPDGGILPRRADQGQQACRNALRQIRLVLGQPCRCPRHALPRRGIGQKARGLRGQACCGIRPIWGFNQGISLAQPGDDFAEIKVMRADQDGAAKPRGFQRVLDRKSVV